MTANDAKASNAGASSPAAQKWDQANWPHIEAEVKRLQMRIAKAVQEGRWGKAKALQRLLTHSRSGKMLAVKRVTENRGKRTPGVDGTVWKPSAARWNGMLSMRHRGYCAMPLRRVYIPKSNGKRPSSLHSVEPSDSSHDVTVPGATCSTSRQHTRIPVSFHSAVCNRAAGNSLRRRAL